MKKELVWLILIYCAAHLPLLATTGQCYDDWALFLVDSRLNVDVWTATGRPLTGQFLNLVRDLGGVFLARLCTFAAYLLAGLLFAETLKSVRFVDPPARFVIAALFMVFPADATRVLPMLAYDSFCYFLFFLGFWLLSRYLESRWIPARIGALCAFFFSFWLNSFLVLYLLPVLFIAYRQWESSFNIRWVIASIRRYADFVCVPLVFWGIQNTLYSPAGVYDQYNRLILAGLSPKAWILAFKAALLDPVVYSLVPLDWLQVGVVFIGSCVLSLLWKKDIATDATDSQTDLMLLGVGALAVFLALFPYVIVGKAPGYWDWVSRHARLVPLGAGFMLYYGLRMIARWVKAKGTTVLAAYCVLLCIFVTGNVKTYGEYWVDWYKALSLIDQFKSSEVIRDHTSFLFRDEASQFNAKKRWLRFYEYAALMSVAFGDEKRFGNEEKYWSGVGAIEDLVKLLRGDAFERPIANHAASYRLSEWTPKEPEYLVTIVPVVKSLGVREVVTLKYRELCDATVFTAAPPQLVRLEYAKIQPR